MTATFASERIAADDVRLVRQADMRYQGQEHTVTVPIPDGPLDEDDTAEVRRRFDDAHERLYTFRLDVPAELVTFRLTGYGTVPKPPLREIAPGGDVSDARTGSRLDRLRRARPGRGRGVRPRGARAGRRHRPGRPRSRRPRRRRSCRPACPRPSTGSATSSSAPEPERCRPNSALDPFTIEVVKDGLTAVGDEMFETLLRTSMSPIIYEVLDFASGLTDAQGRLVTQGQGVTGFIGMLTTSVEAVLDEMGGPPRARRHRDHERPLHRRRLAPLRRVARRADLRRR